jgi:hypothetical protein
MTSAIRANLEQFMTAEESLFSRLCRLLLSMPINIGRFPDWSRKSRAALSCEGGISRISPLETINNEGGVYFRSGVIVAPVGAGR